MVSAPAMPAFLFEGDTFAVPSWEFRCDLPPVYGLEGAPPEAMATLFGVPWRVLRAYHRSESKTIGAVFLLPDGTGLGINEDGVCAHVRITNPQGGMWTPAIGGWAVLTPDEFMYALKAIAERNAT